MTSLGMWAVALGAAFAASLCGVLAVEKWARPLHLVDVPNERSSHVVPRPRGGGLGIWVGVLAGATVLATSDAAFDRDAWMVVGAAFAVGLAGLWDDVTRLSIWPRLVVQVAAAAVVTTATGGFDRLPLPPPADLPLGPAGHAAAVLWIVAVTNFFNFMDGADGLAGGQAMLSLVVFAIAMWPDPSIAVAVVASAGIAAFLTRNWAPSRIFLGDCGSAFLGFLLAAVPLLVEPQLRGAAMQLLATSLTLFLLDPVVTLVVRTARGAMPGQPHREHAYQRLFDPRQSHGTVVGALLTAALFVSLLALIGWSRPELGWWTLTAAGLVFVVEWRVAAARQPIAGDRVS